MGVRADERTGTELRGNGIRGIPGGDSGEVQRREDAAGLADHQCPRRHVPGHEPQLPEGVQPAAGQVAEVQGRGAAPAHAARHLDEPPQRGKVALHEAGLLEGESGAHQGHAEIRHAGDADRLPVAPGPLAPEGLEELAGGRVQDHGDSQPLPVHAGDGDGVLRVAVEPVGRAVQGVDDPYEGGVAASLRGPGTRRRDGVGPRARGAAVRGRSRAVAGVVRRIVPVRAVRRRGLVGRLLRHDPVAREALSQQTHDAALGLPVHVGDEVGPGLLRPPGARRGAGPVRLRRRPGGLGGGPEELPVFRPGVWKCLHLLPLPVAPAARRR